MNRALVLLTALSCSPSLLPEAASPPPVGSLHLWADPLLQGEATHLRAEGASPGQEVWFAGSRAGLGQGPCRLGLCLDVRSPILLGRAVADADGVATLRVNVPATVSGAIYLQAMAWGPSGVTQVVSTEAIAPDADRAALLAGVNRIDMGGALLGAYVVHEDRAFPVITDAAGTPFVAAARVNSGKVLTAAHENVFGGALSTPNSDADTLLRNTIAWMAGPNPVIGVEPGNNTALSWLQAQGYNATSTTLANLANVDIWFVNAYPDRSEQDDATVRAWIEGGGNLITAGHGWYWGYSNDDPAHNHPGNHVLRDAGILLTEEATVTGAFNVTAPSPLSSAARAADALTAHISGGPALGAPALALAVGAVDAAVAVVPLDWPWWDRIATLQSTLGPTVPTRTSPISPASQPLPALSARIDHRLATTLPPADVDAHPAHVDFPGAVPPAAPRVSRTLTVSATYAGRDRRYFYSNAEAPVWRGTGLYAPAGEVIRVTIPAAAAGRGLHVRLGVHTDTLWGNDTWSRFPEITVRRALDTTVTELTSAFGGPVQIEVPPGLSLGDIQVTIGGAVAMARYVAGQTTPQQWLTERALTAPWAELEGASYVMNVPIADARAVPDIAALVAFWDEVAQAEDALGAIPNPPRKERTAVDRQISGGWMHSGYPFMAHLESTTEFTDLALLRSTGSWGAFHELGHNHQHQDWLLPGTTESSCNLWSVYVMEEVVGLSRDLAHPAISPAERQARVAAYIAGGRDFWGDWNVWTALETYLQLQEAFGWDFYQDLFADYAADPAGTVPDNDQARIDTWVLRSSQRAGVNLGPFYLAWGFPVSQAVLTQVSTLPAWTADPMNP